MTEASRKSFFSIRKGEFVQGNLVPLQKVLRRDGRQAAEMPELFMGEEYVPARDDWKVFLPRNRGCLLLDSFFSS